MKTENVCPFCGEDNYVTHWDARGRPYMSCNVCASEGPLADTEAEAELAFCHPAHLCRGMVPRQDFEDAAKSLQTISRMHGQDVDLSDIRQYADSRARVAFDALAAQEEGE